MRFAGFELPVMMYCVFSCPLKVHVGNVGRQFMERRISLNLASRTRVLSKRQIFTLPVGENVAVTSARLRDEMLSGARDGAIRVCTGPRGRFVNRGRLLCYK